jgi:hypothetical protein
LEIQCSLHQSNNTVEHQSILPVEYDGVVKGRENKHKTTRYDHNFIHHKKRRSTMVVVGSVIRAKRPASLLTIGVPKNDHSDVKCTCRAVVATVQDDGKSICVLWEPLAPRPLPPCNRHDFLITPKFDDRNNEDEDEDDSEAILSLEEVRPLLEFETTENSSPSQSTSTTDVSLQLSISTWKDRGDTLLRLGDASSATSYYERALYQSNQVSIGSTIIISIQGFPKIAEVDCIEDESDDDGSPPPTTTNLDVTIVDTGEEKSIKSTSVLIGILDSDPEKLQERIFLNLARCMLQLADLDSGGGRRSKYLKAAVLATTLVIAIASYRDHNDEDSKVAPNAQTAMILRVKAQSGLSKWPNAMADAKQLVKAGNDQGVKLVASLERQKKLVARTDKKLAKEMCRLVESSTASGSVSASTNPHAEASTLSERPLNVSPSKTHAEQSPILPLFSTLGLLFYLVLPVAAAILITQLAIDYFKN